MFRAYLGPSSGGTTVCIQQLVFIIFLDDYLLSWLDLFHPKRIINTNCCVHTVVPPDDGHRYAPNMKRLTKYTKNRLYIKVMRLYQDARSTKHEI
jgi:hypothetical protein